MKRKIILWVLVIDLILLITIYLLEKIYSDNGFFGKILYLLMAILIILGILIYKGFADKVPPKTEDKKEDEVNGK
ncbi:MAG: hypothetical protein JXJ04_19535 [Spirochaetales bacterium]|nr:hypothetical protein [Spirochaetales bacterium]